MKRPATINAVSSRLGLRDELPQGRIGPGRIALLEAIEC